MKLKFFISVLLTLVILFFVSCIDTPKKPVTPSWDVELQLPIGIKTFTVEDIVKKQDEITILPTKTLKFSTKTIQQDTTLDFLFSNTFDMEADTSFPVVGTGFDFNMIVARDSIRMDSAEIQDGEVKYRLKNNNPFAVSVNFVFPGFTRTFGGTIDTFKISATVPANQTLEVTTLINNYRYRQPSNQPFGATRPGVWIRGRVSSSIIGIGQNLEMKFQIEKMRFRSFSGRVKPFNLGYKSQTVQNDLSGQLKDFVKAVTFNQAFLTLTTSTTFKGYDVLLKNLQVVGKYKNNSPPVYLLFNGVNYKDIFIPAGQTVTEVFSTSNTNINQFIKATPDSIEVKATIVMNPQYKNGSINTSDKVSFSTSLEAYSQMKVENAIITDTAEVDWDEETKSKLSQGNSAVLDVELTNGLPFELQLVGFFLDKNKNKLFYYTRQTGNISPSDTSITIPAASINANGEVTVPSKTTIKIALDRNDFEKFKNAAVMVNRFRISSAQNQTVIVNADGYIRHKIFGKVNYRIK
ncbi:MAG: hypothetical protein N3F03_07400 [Ignavibacteria bacterium]|nr:hypothetical protein [Ignavibacteria bacterium]